MAETYQIDGEEVTVSEDQELGNITKVLQTSSFELRIKAGMDDAFKLDISKKKKDGTPKVTLERQRIMKQEFIMSRMKKIKDVYCKKTDFWNSYLAFHKHIFQE